MYMRMQAFETHWNLACEFTTFMCLFWISQPRVYATSCSEKDPELPLKATPQMCKHPF